MDIGLNKRITRISFDLEYYPRSSRLSKYVPFIRYIWCIESRVPAAEITYLIIANPPRDLLVEIYRDPSKVAPPVEIG